jgi:catechol 2,3-dioxygenase-like lactoylglutathione lyase family enzyme
MPKIIGIGGVFIFAHNTELLADWYQRHLGFSLDRMVEDDQSATYYQELYYRDLNDPNRKLHTVFAIMPAKQELHALRNQAMINYRVDDLDAFVQHLHDAGITTDPIHIGLDAEGNGKFTHLYDPEGNRIELWQHIDS